MLKIPSQERFQGLFGTIHRVLKYKAALYGSFVREVNSYLQVLPQV
jgi:hypothetical protein